MDVKQYYSRERVIPSKGNVPMSMGDINQITQGYREIANVGKVVAGSGADISQQKFEADYYDQMNTARTATNQRFFDFQKSLEGRSDTDKWDAELKALQADTSIGDKITNRKAKEHFTAWLADRSLEEQQQNYNYANHVSTQNLIKSQNIQIDNIHYRTVNAIDDIGFQSGIIEAATMNGLLLKPGTDATKIENYIKDPNFKNPLHNSDEVSRASLEGFLRQVIPQRQKLIYASAMNDMQAEVQRGIDSGWTKKQAIEFVDKTVSENPILKADADSKRIGGENASGYYNSRNAKDKQDKYNTELNITKGLTQRLINPKPNEPLPTMVDVTKAFPTDSKEDVANYNSWQARLKGAYEHPEKLPKETTSKGQETVMSALSDMGKGLKTPLDVHKIALNERYGGLDDEGNAVKPSISDKTLKYVIDKIENPLPLHVSQQLQATMESVKKSTQGTNWNPLNWGTTFPEEARAYEINEAINQNISDGLLDWVDKQIASGKVPTPKEIHEMAGQLTPGAIATTQAKQLQSGEPQTVDDFERKVADLKRTDKKQAKEYYEKWVSKWQ